MDDSHKRIQWKKNEADASVNQILLSFFFAIIGLIAGTLIGGALHDYIHMAGEIIGPFFAIVFFAWGLSLSRKK
jgi:hypothetical protein